MCQNVICQLKVCIKKLSTAWLGSGVLDMREVLSTRTEQSLQIEIKMPKWKEKHFDIARIRRGKKILTLQQILKNKDKRLRSNSFHYPNLPICLFSSMFCFLTFMKPHVRKWWEKKIFKVREKSGNFILSPGKKFF